MKQIFLLFGLFFFLHRTEAQQHPIQSGKWKGIMHIFRQNKLMDSVDVELTIADLVHDSIWQWKMEYLSPKMPVTKDYKLIVSDRKKGIFLTDEGDGTILKEYLHGNKLYSIFETGGYLLTSTTEWRENQIIFEVSSGKKEVDQENAVTNFSVDVIQRVVLKRI